MKDMSKKSVVIAILSAISMAVFAEEQVLASWQGGDDRPYIEAEGLVASNDLDSISTFNPTGQGSLDGDYGTFAGAPTSEGTFATGGFVAPAGSNVLNFTITNIGTVDYELTAFRFDGYRQYNGSAMPVISIVSGGGLTPGEIPFDTGLLPQKAGVSFAADDWDDVDLSLTGLEDNVLEAGESVTFRLVADGTAPNFTLDNVAVTGDIFIAPFKGLVMASWQGGDERPYIEGYGLVASNDLNSGSTFNASGQGSLDGDYGTFAGAPTSEGTFATGSFEAPIGSNVLNFTITNVGPLGYELEALHFDGYRQFNGSAMPEISVVEGGGITAGSLIFDTDLLPQKNGVSVVDVDDWDDIDIGLSGLTDNILEVGESVTFRMTAEGVAPKLSIDSVALTGFYAGSVGPVSGVVSNESIVMSWDGIADKYYAVERSTNLVSGVWVPVQTNITGLGTVSVTGDLSFISGFYRVVEEN